MSLPENNKKIITKNSVDAYKLINESTSETDIASFEQIIGYLTESKYKQSLAYQICEVQPVLQNAGAIFAVQPDGSDLTIVKKAITMIKKTTSTGMTQEVYQDIKSMFPGQDAESLIASILKFTSDKDENTEILAKLTSVANSSTFSTLTYTAPSVAETVLFETNKKVSEVALKINQKLYKSLRTFAVVPPKVAAGIMGMGFSNMTATRDEKDLYIGTYDKIMYFVSPDENSTKIFVGIADPEFGKSSLIFSPHQFIISKATDYNTGEDKVFLINRFAVTENPLSTVQDPMVYSFNVVI